MFSSFTSMCLPNQTSELRPECSFFRMDIILSFIQQIIEHLLCATHYNDLPLWGLLSAKYCSKHFMCVNLLNSL